MSKIRLMLADDHAVVRSGLRMLLEVQPDMEIVGEVESGAEAVREAPRLKPDVILMDVQMPDMNGIEATQKIRETCPDTAVLALTMYEEDQYFFEMLKAGAAGYVPKRAAPNDLVRAIRTVNKGEVFLYPSMASKLVHGYLTQDDEEDVEEASVEDVPTPREQEVLVLIADGMTNNEIAEELVISVKTVDRHRENIMRKLDMHSRIDLVKYAIKKGVIDLYDE